MKLRVWGPVYLLALGCPALAAAQDAPPPDASAPERLDPEAAAPVPAAAPPGTVAGRVIDGLGGGPMAGAFVEAEGTEHQTVTDAAGAFTLTLPPGTYTIQIAYEAYRVQKFSVTVASGQARTLRAVRLQPDLASGKVTINVVREPDRNSTEAQNLVRKHSSRISDIVSAEEIRKSADASASQAAARVVGATVVGDRFVYVRGLGERYGSALFNGAPLPSPEPDQQAVPFDIFPANLLANLTIAKSFTPDLPGDFAGGSVQINTKEFPSQLTASVSLSGGLNLSTAFQPYLTYPGGLTDWLGINDGTRAIPAGALPGLQREGGGYLSRKEVAEVARAFPNVWTPRETLYGPPNYGLGFSIGSQHRFGERRLGYLLSLSYASEHQTREPEHAVYIPDMGRLDPQVRLTGKLSLHEVQWGGMGSLVYEPAPRHRLSLVGIFTQSADDEARYLSGFSVEARSEVFTTRLRWIERTFGFVQLSGLHGVSPRHPRLTSGDVDWRLTYARAVRAEPDNREVFRIRGDDGRYSFSNSGHSGQRFFSDNREDQVSGGVDYTQGFKHWAGLDARFKTGALVRFRLRDFNARRFQFFSYGQDAAGMPIDALPPEELFAPTNISEMNGVGVELRENTNPADRYGGHMGVYSAYALLDLPLLPRVRLVGGMRFEAAQQRVSARTFNGDPVAVGLDTYDPMPSVALQYRVRDSMNLRLSGSMTVARPEFRELSPFQFTDFYGGELVRGNPDLQRTRIVNADARWEWFLGAADLLAVSAFYKFFDNPIEATITPGSTLIRSYANAPAAHLVGLELEGRKDVLGSRPDKRAALSFGGNASLIYSRVDLQDRCPACTSRERPLQGQSPFVINAFVELEHLHPRYGTQVRALYNVFGERIDQVGSLDLPDRYQQPRHMLDVTFTQQLGHGFGLRLSGRNLLDSPVHVTQGGETTLRYRTGRIVSLTLSYNR